MKTIIKVLLSVLAITVVFITTYCVSKRTDMKIPESYQNSMETNDIHKNNNLSSTDNYACVNEPDSLKLEHLNKEKESGIMKAFPIKYVFKKGAITRSTVSETIEEESTSEIAIGSEASMDIPKETAYIPKDNSNMGCLDDGLTW